MRVSPGSLCESDPTFSAALNAQIPPAQRAPETRAELVAEVAIAADGTTQIHVFDRVLQADAGARELRLDPSSCAEMAEAVSLVLAVLFEAGRGAWSEVPAPAPPPPPPPPPPPSASVVTPPASEAAPVAKRQRHVWLGPRAGHDLQAAVGINYGLLPSATLAVTAGWGVRWRNTWPIWLHATGSIKELQPATHARFRTVYGGLLTCPLTWAWQRLRVRACPSFSAGAVWAEGYDLPTASRATSAVYLLGLELGAHVALAGPLELSLTPRADGSLTRPRFLYYTTDGRTSLLHQPQVVVVSIFAGLGLRFR